MYKLNDVIKICGGRLVNGNINSIIPNFSISFSNVENSFFVPAVSKDFDRVNKIIDAVKAGCMGFFITESTLFREEIEQEAISINPGICIVEVSRVNTALYKLGVYYRNKNLDKDVIAVTGSYGKTSLCSMISKVLESEVKVLHDFYNLNWNTNVTIAFSYLDLMDYDMAVTEVGIADVGVMDSLARLTRPNVCVINSIGSAHLNQFKTKEKVMEEKLHLLDYMEEDRVVFLNKDDEMLSKVRLDSSYDVRYYSINEASNINIDNGSIKFTAKIYDEDVDFDLKLYGDYNIRNVILAIKIGEMYGISKEGIIKGINEYKSVKGRFRVLRHEKRDLTLVDDTYNSCLESVIYGLESADKIKSKRKIAILGTVATGANGREDSSKAHEEIGKHFEKMNYDYLFVTGDFTKHILKGAEKVKGVISKRFKSKEDLVKELDKIVKDGDLIYIKDGWVQDFETIVDHIIKTY